MCLIEITPDSVLLFMANKSDKDIFEITPNELRKCAHYIEKLRPSYRCEAFSNWDSLNYLLAMKDWAPMMFEITYQGKEDRYRWDYVKVYKNHRNWEYMYDRYVPKKELENFEKGYQEYITNNITNNKINMKKIYCIETWWKEMDREGYPKEYFRDGSFWATTETPWKIGCFNFVEEFDDEEAFKKEILRIINNGGIIGKVWIKEEKDDYKPLIKL